MSMKCGGMIVNALTYEADKMCPFKWMKVNVSKPLWFTSHMSEVARSRDILFRNYLRGKRKNAALYEKAVKKRKEFNNLVKKSRDCFYTIKSNSNYIKVTRQGFGKL